MRVLFISRARAHDVGGHEIYVTEIVAALRYYCDVHCVRPRFRRRIPLGRSFAVTASLLLLLVRSFRYDIIHLGESDLGPLGFLIRIRSRHVPIILSGHGREFMYQESPTFLGVFLRLYWLLARKSPCSAVIANSPFTAVCARKYLRSARVTAIPLAGRPPCAPLSSPPDRNYLLFVGRMTARKGIDWFAEQVLPRIPDLKLIVVGHNYLSASRFRWLTSHPQIEYTPVASGPVSAEIRRRAFACIVPNRASPIWDPEGFGIVAAEHAHTGRPTVATAVQGLTAAVADGITGFLVPPDAEAWVKKLTQIRNWEDRKFEAFSERCVAYAADHFTWDRVARDTIRVYQRYVSVPDEINAIR